MSGEWRTLTGREVIQHYLRAGYTPTEIEDKLAGQTLLLDGDGSEVLHLRDAHGRRRLGEIIEEITGPPTVSHWPEIEDGYRKAKERWGKRPTLEQVANEIPVAEDTLRTWVHAEGIRDWRYIHPRMV